MSQSGGTVTIAPHALLAIISQTVLEVPGAARLGSVPPRRVGNVWSGSHSRDGVFVRVTNTVSVDIYLIAQSDINLLDLGTEVQAAVAKAIREMVGMPVREVNVYIQDVEAAHGS